MPTQKVSEELENIPRNLVPENNLKKITPFEILQN